MYTFIYLCNYALNPKPMTIVMAWHRYTIMQLWIFPIQCVCVFV